MSERCELCRFWECGPDEPEIGKCRRLPPRAVTEVDAELHELVCMIADNSGAEHRFQPISDWFGAFPLTLLDAWCGEFRPLTQGQAQ